MILLLSVTSFLLSVAAIVVGAEALRRINGQNEEFLKSYVKQIRVDLDHKDKQMSLLKKEVHDLKQNRRDNLETLHRLEQETSRKRDGESGRPASDKPDKSDKYGDFIPSSAPAGKQEVA